MTTRQTILEIVEDSRNREELLARLSDFVLSESDRQYSMGQRAGRIGSKWDAQVAKLASYGA